MTAEGVFAEDAENAEDFAVDLDRHVQQRADALRVSDVVRHARVGQRIFDGDRLAGERHAAGDALAERVRHPTD